LLLLSLLLLLCTCCCCCAVVDAARVPAGTLGRDNQGLRTSLCACVCVCVGLCKPRWVLRRQPSMSSILLSKGWRRMLSKCRARAGKFSQQHCIPQASAR
jgi:hypothetical protein